MKSLQVTFEPNDWVRGEQTLQEIAQGITTHEKADLFRASLAMFERAERVLAMGITWHQVLAGQLEGFPSELKDFFQQEGVGGHQAEANALRLVVPAGGAVVDAGVPYAATVYAVRSMLANNVLVVSSQAGGAQMGVAPGVLILVGVLGTAAIAGASWWATERSHDQVRIATHAATMMAEVDRYIRELEIKIAAGMPLPEPPKLIERAAAAQRSGPWVLIGLAATGGALAAYGAYKGITSKTPARARPALPQKQNPAAGGPAAKRSNPYRNKPIAKTLKGQPVVVKPGRYDDNYPGVWYVVGTSGVRDYKIARHPGDPWEVIISRRRVKRAPGRANPAKKTARKARPKVKRSTTTSSTTTKKTARKARPKVKRSTTTSSTTTKKTKNGGRVTVKKTTTRSNPKKRKNPLASGYSAATVSKNVRQLKREGYNEGMAAAIALKLARSEWRKSHPKGGYPKHLQTMAERAGHKKASKKAGAKRRPKAGSRSRSSKTKAPAKGRSGRSRGRSSAVTSAKASAARKRRAKSAKRSSKKSATSKRPAKRRAARGAKKRAPKRAAK